MIDQDIVDVLIVGAGPGGSSAALATSYFSAQPSRAPLSILLIDKHETTRTRANTILLDDAPAHALEKLGCDIADFTPSSDWCQICPEEEVFNSYPLPEYKSQTHERILFNAWFMLRRKPVFDVGINYLERVIYTQIDKNEHINRVHGCSLVSLTSTDDHSFCATLIQDNKSRNVLARYLIVADGANSDTLSQIGARKKGKRKLETIVSANFKQPGVGNTKYHNNNRSVEALSLATRQGTSVFVKVPQEVNENDYALSTEKVQKRYKRILMDGARKLGVEGEIGFGFSLISIALERSSRSIYQNNIFVIGDARHATTPRVALGANVAIMDAIRAAHTVATIHNSTVWRAQLARFFFSWHTFLGTHILTLLGRITTTSQAVKASSTMESASAFTRAYKFWKTQLLMATHWSAGKGVSKIYKECDANKLINTDRRSPSGEFKALSRKM
jgi:2-polyprenyl-6-methoxyphenol hydroxylase-like FAD-dependent oxidoreductase